MAIIETTDIVALDAWVENNVTIGDWDRIKTYVRKQTRTPITVPVKRSIAEGTFHLGVRIKTDEDGKYVKSLSRYFTQVTYKERARLEYAVIVSNLWIVAFVLGFEFQRETPVGIMKDYVSEKDSSLFPG